MPLSPTGIYTRGGLVPEFSLHPSRRSTVHSTKGIVACTQPLAATAGQRILAKGGNAADAAVAVAAALNMSEPTSTGIGGDMFCLFYDAKTKQVHSLNGSGRSPAKQSLEGLRKELGLKDGQSGEIPIKSVHSVTIPGAAAGWVDTVERFGSGKVTLTEVLTPAIEMGEEGFPVAEIAAYYVCTNDWKIFETNIYIVGASHRQIKGSFS
jgi:gamma-glutamyltranspeptidase / glutathione hydrolase